MKKHEAVYDWIKVQVETLADSPAAEAYASTLGEDAIDDFVALTEKLRGDAAGLYQAKTQRAHYTHWREVRDSLSVFSDKFASFPGVSFQKLLLFALLCDVLAQSAPDMDAQEVDQNLFGVCAVSLTLPSSWFFRKNGRQLHNSVVFFKPSRIEQIEEAIANQAGPSDLLFHVLATLSVFDGELPEAAVVVKKTNPARDSHDVENFVKLHLLMEGQQIHTPALVTRAPSVVEPDVVAVDIGYAQWSDALMVMSEYNSRGELLLKFLTIYQLLENLMFKLPIVKLERARCGAMFSLREFKALYSSISINEQSALDELFRVIFAMEVPGKGTFKTIVESDWVALEASAGADRITQEIARSGIRLNGSFTGQNFVGNYSKIVYVLRNSVVHNKETEFHLTSESLTDPLKALIETFLLPTLEKMVFWVISTENHHLWYQNKRLALY